MSAMLEKLLPEAQVAADNAVCIDAETAAIVIVGSGPVGMQFASELLCCNQLHILQSILILQLSCKTGPV